MEDDEYHSEYDYDKNAINFSPDGRLLQVEYAREAINKGATTIGVKTKEGIVLVVEKISTTALMEPESFMKIFLIDDHIGIATSGLVSDAQVLIDAARLEAQRNFASYDEPIDVKTLCKKMCTMKQYHTQYSGMRPFGSALLVAGYDKDGEPQLYETDPSGAMLAYKATAIGQGKGMAINFMEGAYNPDMDLNDAVIMAILALHDSQESTFKANSIEIGLIDKESKLFRKLSVDEVKVYADEIEKLIKELD